MAFVGYVGDSDNNMIPIATGDTYEDCFTKTFNRLVDACEGDRWTLSMAQIAVRERDITPLQAAELDALIEKQIKNWKDDGQQT